MHFFKKSQKAREPRNQGEYTCCAVHPGSGQVHSCPPNPPPISLEAYIGPPCLHLEVTSVKTLSLNSDPTANQVDG